MSSGIYKIANKLTGDFYIGSAINLTGRFNSHKSKLVNNIHESPLLQNVYNKYGLENLQFEVVELINDKTKLIDIEQKYLDELRPKYNICKIAGSRLGQKATLETKKKLSNLHKGNKYCLGYKHTEETKKKMSLAHKGFKHTEESKEKISKTKTGVKRKPFSKQHKENLSKGLLGNTRSLGYKHSAETKRKMSEAQINRFKKDV